MGWVSGIMIDRIVGHYHSPVLPKWLPGVRVHVESRKVAARDVNPDAVSLLEHVPRREWLDYELVDLSLIHI